MTQSHITPIRVYYEDTDSGGIVYHPNFLSFGERARCELMRDLGYQCSDIDEKLGLQFVVKHADIEYIKPARLDDALEVHTSILAMRNTSFQCVHDIKKADDKEGKDICKIIVTLVCVDTNEIKPVRIPDLLRNQLQTYITESIDI